jgi:hypothetical protein
MIPSPPPFFFSLQPLSSLWSFEFVQRTNLNSLNHISFNIAPCENTMLVSSKQGNELL